MDEAYKDLVTFAQGVFSYGWITRRPSETQQKMLLRCIGTVFPF